MINRAVLQTTNSDMSKINTGLILDKQWLFIAPFTA